MQSNAACRCLYIRLAAVHATLAQPFRDDSIKSRFRGPYMFSGPGGRRCHAEVITVCPCCLAVRSHGALIGWPAERCIMTIWIAHTTFCIRYCRIVAAVAGRLESVDRRSGMDVGRHLENLSADHWCR